MEKRVLALLARWKEVEDLLGQPDTVQDQKLYRELTKEHSYLSDLKHVYDLLKSLEKQLQESQEMAKDESDPHFLEVVQEEISQLEDQVAENKRRLETLLVPPDPLDHRNIILELRAGTGGDEAALFVGDCARMYRHYSIQKKWQFETISSAPSDMGGFKEYIVAISGNNVHRLMQYEGGTHRVQRVPETETQGRVHTSAITIAVLLEPDQEEKVSVDEKDLKIDTYRASGAGGQHVNVTDSAVRLTHIPTGVVVTCQEERSQHKNKEKAMRLLGAKLAEEKRRQLDKERSDIRSTQIGTGDRSERIRTYNFSQNRITDHRINLTLYKLDRILEGDLDEITEALVAHFYNEKLLGR